METKVQGGVHEKEGVAINASWIIAILVIVAIAIFATLFFNQGSSDGGKTSQAPVKATATNDISHKAGDVPPQIAGVRQNNETVVINLDAVQLVGELAEGTTYEYWTFNKQVPGPFIRVMEGDTVEVNLTHSHDHMALSDEDNDFPHSFAVDFVQPIPTAYAAEEDHEHAPGMADDHPHDADMPSGMSHEDMSDDAHTAAGHGEHSIDLHAVQGPGGGAELTRAAPNATESFRFKAMKPGIYIYHCGSPHVPTHVANGMYGMILVEPKGGLSPVDREFYVVQGEFYTKGKVGEKGHQEYSLEKLLDERPEYVVFNGRMGALTGNNALTAKVGEKIRIFFGVSGQLASNFHVIGEVLDKVYREGDLLSPPARNIQTTLVPAGGAMMTEFIVEVPGKYLLVDHALSRAVNRGALGELVVTGPDEQDIFEKI
jgi:nitrite reductase (NO-forming)